MFEDMVVLPGSEMFRSFDEDWVRPMPMDSEAGPLASLNEKGRCRVTCTA